VEGLLRVLEALKNMPRTGWVQRGVPPAVAEVVASHIYEASIICLEIGYGLAELGVIGSDDTVRATMMALVHDIGEGVTGDLNRYMSRELGRVKEEIEEKAVGSIGSYMIYSLYREYKAGASKASKLAHLCDRLSTYIQAKRYMALGYSVEEIAKSTAEDIKTISQEICGDNPECLRKIAPASLGLG